jgi:CheY-like chemotaxis protein
MNSGQDKQTILILEDEVVLVVPLLRILRQRGYQVYFAEDGSEGIGMAKTYSPDLILLDLILPGMSGEDFLRRIRETEWGKDIPVIIMTNMISDNKEEMEKLGVSGYLMKADMALSAIADLVEETLEKGSV